MLTNTTFAEVKARFGMYCNNKRFIKSWKILTQCLFDKFGMLANWGGPLLQMRWIRLYFYSSLYTRYDHGLSAQ